MTTNQVSFVGKLHYKKERYIIIVVPVIDVLVTTGTIDSEIIHREKILFILTSHW